MDYSYKITPSDTTRRMLLSSNALHLYLDGHKYTTPYNKVVGVWLSKPSDFLSGNNYGCTLNIEDAKPIYISIKNFDSEGSPMDQSNHYNSFIRVLHVHLQEKSKAHYYFGEKPVSYAMKVLVLVSLVSACLMSYTLFNINGLIVLPVGAILAISAYALLRFGIKSFPKLYNPKEIPIGLLPN